MGCTASPGAARHQCDQARPAAGSDRPQERPRGPAQRFAPLLARTLPQRSIGEPLDLAGGRRPGTSRRQPCGVRLEERAISAIASLDAVTAKPRRKENNWATQLFAL